MVNLLVMSSLLISSLSIPWWQKQASGPLGSTLAQGIPSEAFAHGCRCRGVVVFVGTLDVVVVVFVIVVDLGDDEVS